MERLFGSASSPFKLIVAALASMVCYAQVLQTTAYLKQAELCLARAHDAYHPQFSTADSDSRHLHVHANGRRTRRTRYQMLMTGSWSED